MAKASNAGQMGKHRSQTECDEMDSLFALLQLGRSESEQKAMRENGERYIAKQFAMDAARDAQANHDAINREYAAYRRKP